MTIRSDYLEDFCSSISMYLAGGNRMSIQSSTDKLGHLVIALTFDDSAAFHASMSTRLADGALSRSFANVQQPEAIVESDLDKQAS
ncbi:MAG: hypothetical protein WCL53_03500 [Chloroflexota bacterium]